MENVLEVHDLTIAYQNKPVLWGVDFDVPEGKLTGIIGPNGAGKSTLLKAIMGITPIASGYVKIFNKNLGDVRQKVAYIPQKESVDWDFPVSVMDVVLMGRYGKRSLFSKLTKEDKKIATACLQKVNLLDFANNHISELSGGQKQRVFIARALAQEADVYFMDEPFAGIDITSEKAIMDILLTMQKEGKSIFVVHHDLQSAMDYFDWVIFINNRLIKSGSIESTFNIENLEKTYGGKLSMLSQIAKVYESKKFPIREK